MAGAVARRVPAQATPPPPWRGYGREAAINPHKEQLRRFQEGRALQVELKQTVGINVPIEERGQSPEIFRLQPLSHCT
jgi:hypothetical protein